MHPISQALPSQSKETPCPAKHQQRRARLSTLKAKSPSRKRPRQETALEARTQVRCVFRGNQIEAARLAGFKQPEKVASVIFNRPQVRAAIEAKQAAFVKKVGEREARGVTVTRNDIINRLDDLSHMPRTIPPRSARSANW